MSDDGRPRPHDQWHAALLESDRAARAAEDGWMVDEAVSALEDRLEQANADRHALSEAVRLRDRLLGELSQAVRERDELVARLEGDLARLRAMAAQPLHRRVARGLRREVRRLVGRPA